MAIIAQKAKFNKMQNSKINKLKKNKTKNKKNNNNKTTTTKKREQLYCKIGNTRYLRLATTITQQTSIYFSLFVIS